MPATTATGTQGRRHPNPAIDGAALRRARRGRLTTRELAEECTRRGTRVDYGNLGRAERGELGGISVDKALTVAQVLGIDVREILTSRGMVLMGYKPATAAAPLERAS